MTFIIIIHMSIIRYVITILLCLILVSSYQRDDSNAEALGTPLPPYDVNETEDIYQDLEYFEGAGDGNYGHNECDYG